MTGVVLRSRKITVIAAEQDEASDVMREVGTLARDGKLEPVTKLLPRAYRWHDGNLVPVIWKGIGGEVGAIGQEEWADGY